MPEIQLYDSEEDKLYSFPVSQEHFDAIIAGDLTLASKLLEKEKEKNNFVAAYNVMKESTKQQDREQDLSVPSTSGLSLRLNNKSKNHGIERGIEQSSADEIFERSKDDGNDDENQGVSTIIGNTKTWTTNSIKFLIALCQKYDKDFESGIKKYIWSKIADELTKKFNQKFTAQQCDTKFKVLKNMYKQVKQHNEKSGNSVKKWEYYELMNEIMFSKPEISARATCSSSTGLAINGIPCKAIGTSVKENTTDKSDNAETLSPSYVSAFTSKRKRIENKMEKRHNDKMQRQDRYLDLLERLTNAVEKSTQNDSN